MEKFEDSGDFKMMLDYVRNHTSDASWFELLTEELCELAAETAKYARIMRGEMVSSSNPAKIEANIQEELTDVYICLKLARLDISNEVLEYKTKRMYARTRTRATNEENDVEEGQLSLDDIDSQIKECEALLDCIKNGSMIRPD